MKTKKVQPYDKREDKDMKRAFANTNRGVKPVAKDTNKTRRRMVKPSKRPTIARGK